MKLKLEIQIKYTYQKEWHTFVTEVKNFKGEWEMLQVDCYGRWMSKEAAVAELEKELGVKIALTELTEPIKESYLQAS